MVKSISVIRDSMYEMLDSDYREQKESHLRYVSNLDSTFDVAKRIIGILDSEVMISIDPIEWKYSGEVKMWDCPSETVHKLSKALGIEFKKDFIKSTGKMEYISSLSNVKIVISTSSIPNCEIRQVRRFKEVVTYEINCKEEVL